MESQQSAPLLSTPATHIFKQKLDVNPTDEPVTSDERLWVKYEIERTLQEIKRCRYQRVALQFPDNMLVDAPRVYKELQRGLKLPKSSKSKPIISNVSQPGPGMNQQTAMEDVQAELFILGDTSYGPCCIDEIAAEHADADVVVHYGRTCLSPTARIPSIHIFTKQPLPYEENMLRASMESFPDPKQKLILMADVMYQDHLPPLVAKLNNHGYRDLHLAEIVHDPASGIPNRTVPSEVKLDSAKMREWHIFHLSDPPESLLLILASRVASLCIFPTAHISHEPDLVEVIKASSSRSLSRRYALLTSVSTVPIFGILINTLSVQNYQAIAKRVRDQILASGKKSYTFVVGKLNAAKIANFAEIGAWVVIGCWESSLIDSKEFWKPIITPFELTLALQPDNERIWTGEWSSDFNKILKEIAKKPAESRSEKLKEDLLSSLESRESRDIGRESEEESVPPEFDLRTGRYVSLSRPMAAASDNQLVGLSTQASPSDALVQRLKQDVAVVGGEPSPGAEFLRSNRTWKGLGSDFEFTYEESSSTIEEGRSGIARGYTHANGNECL